MMKTSPAGRGPPRTPLIQLVVVMVILVHCRGGLVDKRLSKAEVWCELIVCGGGEVDRLPSGRRRGVHEGDQR